MKELFVFGLMSVIFSVSAFASPVKAKSADNEAFFFIQLADPQMGMWSGDKDMDREIECFKKAVAHINRLKPAFVLLSGDMTNQAHNPRQIREVWKHLKEIDSSIPVYLVAGNHDVNQPPSEEDIRSYEKLYGSDHYAFSYKGSEFIVMDSSLAIYSKKAPALADAQWKWLESQLKASRAKNPNHLFLCTHCSWFLKQADEKDDYFNVPIAIRNKYLDLMHRYGVDWALAGHYHRNSIGQDGKMQMVTTSALGMPIGNDPSGLRIFKVYKDRVEHSYYGLDQVPEKVQLMEGR